MSTASPEFTPGTIIDGFTITSHFRSRVAASTYLATNADGKSVHITIYSPECFPSALVRERSLRELRQLASVSSPQVVKVYDSGKMDDGGIYEVTEVVEGRPLDEVIPIDRGQAAEIMGQIGDALLAAQKVGVIHRNLGAHMVFGSVAGVKVGGYAVGEPHGGQSFGPLDTMAPEQVSGKVVDQRSLIYNLASLMQQMITGEPLFSGTREEKLHHHLQTSVPEHLDVVLRRALAKDPRMRPMMLKQFLRDMVGSGTSPESDPVSSAAPRAGVPTTRGWTQFMEATEPSGSVEGAGDLAPPQPAIAPASAPVPVSPSAGQPTTRGWTMFMDASDAEESTSEEKPAEPAPSPKSLNQPSTRGWTMFMDAPDDSDSSDSPVVSPPVAVPTPSPSVTVPSAFSPAVSSKSSANTEVQISALQTNQSAGPSVPAPTGTDTANSNASVSDTSHEPTASKSASTRGWTMFMETPLPGGKAAGANPSDTSANATEHSQGDTSPKSPANHSPAEEKNKSQSPIQSSSIKDSNARNDTVRGNKAWVAYPKGTSSNSPAGSKGSQDTASRPRPGSAAELKQTIRAAGSPSRRSSSSTQFMPAGVVPRPQATVASTGTSESPTSVSSNQLHEDNVQEMNQTSSGQGPAESGSPIESSKEEAAASISASGPNEPSEAGESHGVAVSPETKPQPSYPSYPGIDRGLVPGRAAPVALGSTFTRGRVLGIAAVLILVLLAVAFATLFG